MMNHFTGEKTYEKENTRVAGNDLYNEQSTLKQQNTDGRIKSIDIARGIAIVCIVFSHVCWEYSNIIGILKLFHVPVFFFISGIVLNIQKGLKKVFLRYYLSYVKWGIIGLAVANIAYALYDKDCITGRAYVSAAISIFKMNALFPGIGQLWYLIVQIPIVILYIMIIKKYGLRCAIIVAVLLAVLNWQVGTIPLEWGFCNPINVVLGEGLFLVEGYWVRTHANFVQYNKCRASQLCLFLCFLLFVFQKFFHISIDVRSNTFSPSYFLFYLCANIGIMVVFLAASILDGTGFGKILILLGQNTLPILGMHMFVNYIVRGKKLGYVSDSSFIVLIVAFPLSLYVPIILDRLLNTIIKES